MNSFFVPLTACRSSLLFLRLILFILSVCFPATTVSAQEPEAEDVIRVSTDLSVFPIRVRARHQAQPPVLTAADFEFKDPENITTSTYFASGADRVALVFALDESGSLTQIFSQQRDAAMALFERFGKRSRVAVVRFSERPVVAIPFVEDSAEALPAFRFRARPNSRTAIFDGAYSSLKLFATGPHDPTERRIVILISDGLDNASTIKPASVIAAAQNSNVSFYTIQIPLFEPRDGHLAVRGPSNGFKELAERTGGKYFLTADAKSALQPTQDVNLSSVFKAIEDDLRSQYLVGFYFGDKARDNQPHKLTISIKPQGTEYSVAQEGFSRTHNFSIKLPPRTNNQ